MIELFRDAVPAGEPKSIYSGLRGPIAQTPRGGLYEPP